MSTEPVFIWSACVVHENGEWLKYFPEEEEARKAVAEAVQNYLESGVDVTDSEVKRLALSTIGICNVLNSYQH